MEISQLGNNTITYCCACDELFAVKGNYDTEALQELLNAHRAKSQSCKAYYDALPTFEETMAAMREIGKKNCESHDCNPGKCECICDCDVELTCRASWGGLLCSHCALRDIRGDEDHELKIDNSAARLITDQLKGYLSDPTPMMLLSLPQND